MLDLGIVCDNKAIERLILVFVFIDVAVSIAVAFSRHGVRAISLQCFELLLGQQLAHVNLFEAVEVGDTFSIDVASALRAPDLGTILVALC